MDLDVAMIVLGFIALISLVAFFSYRAEKKRTQELEQVARQMGFSFEAKSDTRVLDGVQGFPLYHKRASKKGVAPHDQAAGPTFDPPLRLSLHQGQWKKPNGVHPNGFSSEGSRFSSARILPFPRGFLQQDSRSLWRSRH